MSGLKGDSRLRATGYAALAMLQQARISNSFLTD